MSAPVLLAQALLLLSASLLPSARGTSSIQEMVYTTLSEAKPCVRLLTYDGVIGCNTPSSGTIGTLRYPASQEDLLALVASPPDYRVALVLPQSLFNSSNLQLINSTLKMAGILLLPSDAPPGGYSTADASPQALYDIHEEPRDWNPVGTGMYRLRFDFAIVNLDDGGEASLMQRRAQDNEEQAARGSFPGQSCYFNYFMPAEESSVQCLQDSTCLPVGGYSVWSAFGPPGSFNTPNNTKPIVLGVTQTDSSAFFHDMAWGQDQPMSGVVSLLTAADALSRLPDINNLTSQIVISLFAGEQWGYLGSSKFVADILNFTCDKPGGTDTNPYCEQPYQPTLDFERINISNIERVFELNQVGFNGAGMSQLFMHFEPDQNNTGLDSFVADIEAVAQNFSNLQVLPGGTNGDNSWGVPPSSSQAFLRASPSLPSVVLTDHRQAYTNKYYQSEFDKLSNQDVVALCNVATLTARVLYVSAGGNQTAADSITTNCTLLSTLFDCLTQDFSCPLITSYVPDAANVPAKPNSQYTGVYELMQRKYMRYRTQFYYQFLSFPTGNSSSPYRGNPFYHDAVDPVLVFDYDTGYWTWPSLTNQTYLWTESMWNYNIRTVAFLAEDPTVDSIVLAIGLGLTALTLLAGLFYQRKCTRHFKVV